MSCHTGGQVDCQRIHKVFTAPLCVSVIRGKHESVLCMCIRTRLTGQSKASFNLSHWANISMKKVCPQHQAVVTCWQTWMDWVIMFSTQFKFEFWLCAWGRLFILFWFIFLFFGYFSSGTKVIPSLSNQTDRAEEQQHQQLSLKNEWRNNEDGYNIGL